MKELFERVIKEAKDGKVLLDDEEWPIAFNTIIEETGEVYENPNNFSSLIVKEKDEFISLLEEYVSLELSKKRKNLFQEKEKAILVNLFVNATTEDFLNPEEFMKRRISFLKDNTLSNLDNRLSISLGKVFQDSNLEIQRKENSIMMETPYKMMFTLEKDGRRFSLPSIYYGINQGTCYIYSMLKEKEKSSSEEEMKYQKQMNRLLYKLNEGVEESKEYEEYKRGESDYYPEGNISDITHSFLLSLNVFLSLLNNEDIKDIKVVSYLPVRYASRFLTAITSEKEEELLERNDRIQENATNKLIRVFRRLAHQNPNIEITSYPYENDEYLTLRLYPKERELENMLLEETSKIETGNENDINRNL